MVYPSDSSPVRNEVPPHSYFRTWRPIQFINFKYFYEQKLSTEINYNKISILCLLEYVLIFDRAWMAMVLIGVPMGVNRRGILNTKSAMHNIRDEDTIYKYYSIIEIILY